MFTKSALLSFDIKALKSVPSLSNSLLVSAVSKVTNVMLDDTVDLPNHTTLEQIYKRVKGVYEKADNIELSNYDLHYSPWVIFSEFDSDPPFIQQNNFWDFYLKLTKNVDNFRFVSSLYNAYITYYSRDFKSREPVLKKLKEILSNSTQHKVMRFSAEIEKRLTLKEFAHSFIKDDVNSTDSISKTLRNNGLLGGHGASKLTLAVLTDYLSQLPNQILSERKANKQLSDLVNFCHDSGKLKYPEMRIEIAEAMLFSANQFRLEPLKKEEVKEFLLMHYGDPRVSSSGWHGISEDAMQIMQGWLVEKTMDDFFNLLSHVARTQSDADRHWKYRKRFWNSYLKKGYIKEAWVALGPRAYEQAPHFIKGKNHYAMLQGVDSRHSALFMKIGDLIITEWSHSGSYRIWDSERNAPEFYRKRYMRSDVIDYCDHYGAHHGNESGGWQGRVADYIQRHTGLKVLAKDYMND